MSSWWWHAPRRLPIAALGTCIVLWSRKFNIRLAISSGRCLSKDGSPLQVGLSLISCKAR
jgi:hypothetical protein